MTQANTNDSGELSSFLHLTGKRPIVLALVAGLAGAIGLYLALGEPAQWVSRYVVNGSRVAEPDLQPAELDIFVEEIAQQMKLPNVIDAVERNTGLVHEEDYEIVTGQSPSALSLIDVTTTGSSADDTRNVAFETSLAAVTSTLTSIRSGIETTADQLQESVDEDNARIAELTSLAGGVNPTTAYDRAVNNLLARDEFLLNPTCTNVTDALGTVECVPDPEPEPAYSELVAGVDRLGPMSREYEQLQASLDETSLRLADRLASIRALTGSLVGLETERENPRVITEVETDTASRISSLLTGLLLFAVPVALLTILAFFVIDAFRKPSAEVDLPDAPEAQRVIESAERPALPKANVTPLVRAEEELARLDARLEGIDQDDEDAPEGGEEGHDDDPDPSPSSDNRWGRDSKVG